MKTLAVIVLALTLTAPVFAKDPDCTGPNRWPAMMAQPMGDTDQIDFSKTNVTRISSQKIAKDLFLQVHFVRFYKRNGQTIQAITVGNASHEECSAGPVDVYRVSQKLGLRSDAPRRPMVGK